MNAGRRLRRLLWSLKGVIMAVWRRAENGVLQSGEGAAPPPEEPMVAVSIFFTTSGWAFYAGGAGASGDSLSNSYALCPNLSSFPSSSSPDISSTISGSEGNTPSYTSSMDSCSLHFSSSSPCATSMSLRSKILVLNSFNSFFRSFHNSHSCSATSHL